MKTYIYTITQEYFYLKEKQKKNKKSQTLSLQFHLLPFPPSHGELNELLSREKYSERRN